MADIKIYGRLVNDTPDGTIAKASQVKDDAIGKFQGDINADLSAKSKAIKADIGVLYKDLYSGNLLDLAEPGIYINDEGIIANAVDTYKLLKFYSTGKTYFLRNTRNPHPILYKYTDDTFLVPDREIVSSAMTEPLNRDITLENGYYAICVNDSYANASFAIKGDIIKLDEGLSTIETELNDKVDKSSIKQETGESLTDIMSQKAVSNSISVVTYERLRSESLKHINLIDSSLVTDGCYVSWSVGVLMDNPGYYASDFIPVSGGEDVYISHPVENAFYDVNFNFISGFKNSSVTTVPEGACYIRISIKKENLSSAVLAISSEAVEYVPYNYLKNSAIAENSKVIIYTSGITVYKGNLVSYKGTIYKVLAAFTSSVPSTDNVDYQALSAPVMQDLDYSDEATYKSISQKTASGNFIKANQFLFGGELWNIAEPGLYIADNGTIGYATSAYKLLKFHSLGVSCYIRNANNSHPILYQFTDETFETPLKQIIGAYTAGKYNRDVFLEEGYYAFSSTSAFEVSFITTGIKQITDGLSSDIINSKSLILPFLAKSAYTYQDFYKDGCYLSNGNLDGLGVYGNTGLIQVKKGWTAMISGYGGPSVCAIIAFNENQEVIGYRLHNNNIGKYFYVIPDDVKYIAFSAAKSTEIYKHHIYALINKTSDYIQTSSLDFDESKLYQGFWSGNGWDINAKSATSSSTNYLTLSKETFEDKFDFGMTFSAVGESFAVFFGKQNSSVGTMFSLEKEEGVSKLKSWYVPNSQYAMQKETTLETISLESGKWYSVMLTKRVEDKPVYVITITDEYGGIESVEYKGGLHHAWGFPSIKLGSGTSLSLKNVYFKYPFNEQVKVAFFGHSYVEGDSIRNNMDKRWDKLLADEIGLEKTQICGQGGATFNSLITRLYNQLQYMPNLKYAIFYIGVNDASLDLQNMKDFTETIVSICSLCNVMPIFATINQLATGYNNSNFPSYNDWLIENYYTFDIRKAFELPDGTPDANAFLEDDQHPTIETHFKIYNIVKTQAGYIMNV